MTDGMTPYPREARAPQMQSTPKTEFMRRHLLWSLALIGFVVALALIRGLPSLVTYVSLAALSLRSPSWAVRAMTAGIFATLLTGAIAHEYIPVELRTQPLDGGLDAGALVGRYLILGASAFTFIRARTNRQFSLYAGLSAAFFVLILINSLTVSYAPFVSLLKAATLGAGVYTIYRMASYFRSVHSIELENWFLTFFGAVILLGTPLALIPAGRYVNGTGFQGLFDHPQVLGIVCGIYAAAMLQRILNVRPHFALSAIMLCVSVGYIILSEARGGLVTFFVGGGVGALSSLLQRRRTGPFIPATLLLATICIVVLSVPATTDFLSQFLSKRTVDNSSLSSLWQSSRGNLVAQSWQGFLNHPVLGVGFGLPTDSSMLIIRDDPAFGIPMSASVEKGFIVTGTLEELGIVGGIMGASVLLSLFAYVLARSRPEGVGLLAAAVASNLGESTLTSYGGLGAIVWLAIAVALSTASTRE